MANSPVKPIAMSFGPAATKVPVIDPKLLYKQCLEQGIPADSWLRKANSFINPLGKGPAHGMILLTRENYTAVNHELNTHSLIFQTEDLDDELKNLSIVRGKCCDPGGETDVSACYYVTIVDQRYHWARLLCGRRYNMVTADGEDYQDDSTNGDIPWTWQELLEELWNLAIKDGSAVPELEETPHGTPENFDFLQHYALDALCVLLDRLGYALRWTPWATSDAYDMVRLGKDLANDVDLERANHPDSWIWDDYALRPTITHVPSKVAVYFRIYPQDCDEPSYCIVTVPRVPPIPDDEVREDDTTFIIHDDLVARREPSSGSGSLSGSFCSGSASGSSCPATDGCCAFLNAEEIQRRACERARDYYRMITKSSTPFQRVYSGAKHFVPQTRYKAVHWQEWGQGMKTTVFRGNDILPVFGMWEAWYRQLEFCCCTGGAAAGEVFTFTGSCWLGPDCVIAMSQQVCCGIDGFQAVPWYIVFNPNGRVHFHYDETEALDNAEALGLRREVCGACP